MQGLDIARAFLFFLFIDKNTGTYYPCVLIQWFSVIGNKPDDEMGFWMVESDVHQNGQPSLAIIHLNTIYRAMHLIPVYDGFIDRSLTMHDTLDEFKDFYVNKFADHHAFEIAS